MSTISTHVLDTARGVPAAGVPITLEREAEGGDGWSRVAFGVTNEDGRVRDFLPAGAQLSPGRWRMTFETDAYFEALGVSGFYPVVRVEFVIRASSEHYHVPLLLSPYGYSTYRGS